MKHNVNIIQSIQRKYQFIRMPLAVMDFAGSTYWYVCLVCLFVWIKLFPTLWIHHWSPRLGDRGLTSARYEVVAIPMALRRWHLFPPVSKQRKASRGHKVRRVLSGMNAWWEWPAVWICQNAFPLLLSVRQKEWGYEVRDLNLSLVSSKTPDVPVFGMRLKSPTL